MLFLVYPAMIPPKSGPPDMTLMMSGASRSTDASDSLRRRRARDDPESLAQGVGEGVSTAAAALKAERYRPKIFGFQVHEIAKLQRWQEAVRNRYVGDPKIRMSQLTYFDCDTDKWLDLRSMKNKDCNYLFVVFSLY